MLELVQLSAVQFSTYFSSLVCAPFSASMKETYSYELALFQRSSGTDLVAFVTGLLILRRFNCAAYGIFSRQENHMVISSLKLFSHVTPSLRWESLVLLLFYGCYVVFMKFNEDIESWVKSKISRRGEIDPVPEVLSALPSPRSVVDEQEMKSRLFF